MARTIKSIKMEEDKLNREMWDLIVAEAIIKCGINTIAEKLRKMEDKYHPVMCDY